MSTIPYYNLETASQLPPCKGPKLRAFKDRHKPIEFLELISDLPEDSDDSGGHGHVFKVRINEKIYALKIFKFFNIDEKRREIGPATSSRVSDEQLTFHTDPFFAECRAYGCIHANTPSDQRETRQRLKSRQKRRAGDEVAVPCYGFIAVPAEPYERHLRNEFGIDDWDRGYSDPRKPEPFRALVKELVDSDVRIGKPATMLRHLKALRAMGVYPRDVRADNYKNGLLVDFSIAWTSPHWREGILKGERLQAWRDQDLYQFDNMIKDERVITYVRATRNLQYTRKLRNHPYTYPTSSSN